jgi:hypothetical protein
MALVQLDVSDINRPYLIWQVDFHVPEKVWHDGFSVISLG